MSTTYTPADTFHSTVSIPDNGESDDSSVLFGPVKSNADNEKYLYERSAGAAGVQFSVLGPPAYNIADRFTYNAASDYGIIQTDVTSAGQLGWDITGLLHAMKLVGGTISGLEARLDGDLDAGSPHGTIPGGLPTLKLIEMDPSTSPPTVTTKANTTDPSATKEIYDSNHTFSCDPDTVVVDGCRYFVEFAGEHASCAKIGMGLLDILVTVTPAP